VIENFLYRGDLDDMIETRHAVLDGAKFKTLGG
jgi:hypothetical protein